MSDPEWAAGPVALRHVRAHVPGHRVANFLAVLPGLCRAAIHRDPDTRVGPVLPPPPPADPTGD